MVGTGTRQPRIASARIGSSGLRVGVSRSASRPKVTVRSVAQAGIATGVITGASAIIIVGTIVDGLGGTAIMSIGIGTLLAWAVLPQADSKAAPRARRR
jgi:hypothetical protein